MLRDAAAHRAAGLHGFEFLVVQDAAADVVNDLAQGDAQRDFDQAGAFDLAGDGEGLGALALFGAHRGEPCAALVNDLGDVGVGLDVVDVGRATPQAGDGREGRARARQPAFSFDGLHQGGFLAADEGPGSHANFQVEIEAAAEDVLTQQAVISRLLNCHAQRVDGDGVLGANVEVTLLRADGVGRDDHALDDGVRVSFQHAAVHKSAGIALVAVADEVFLIAGGLPGEGPLQPGGESGPAASS